MLGTNKFVNSFREEIVTTGMVMIVTVWGSYYILGRLLNNKPVSEGVSVDESVLGAIDKRLGEKQKEEEDTSGSIIYQESEKTTDSSPQPTTAPTKTPSPSPLVTEISYRPSKDYENDDFFISFNRPRLMVGSSRSFMVDVVLMNKAVTGPGLLNRLYATVLKDGDIIVQEAVMSSSEIASLKVGERISFTASLSLIEGTEVSQIIFVPGNDLPQVTHQVTLL